MLAAANSTYVKAGRHPVAAANLLLLSFRRKSHIAWRKRLPDAVHSNTILSQEI